MQTERGHLRAVFPELAERLRARRHHLEQVDLRWGVVTTEAAGEQAKEPYADMPRQRRRLIASPRRARWRPASSSLTRRENPDVGPIGRAGPTSLEVPQAAKYIGHSVVAHG